jgi:4,5-DOPA dioxygenase extradiol
MDRRSVLQTAIAAGVGPLVGACQSESSSTCVGDREGSRVTMKSGSGEALPAIFVAHGSPMLIDDASWNGELAGWAAGMHRPQSILVISAHWVDRPVTLSATRTRPLVYDFYGFPKKYYEIDYRAPGAPELAARVRNALSPLWTVADDPQRGLDHGTYMPLLAMVPNADIPVLQMSIPSMDPEELVAIGRKLAPLRREGVLVMGSGFLTHNMRAIDLRPDAQVPSWASEFDAWVADALRRRDVDALLTYRERAPGVRMALPTHEHFVPVLVALGASLDESEGVAFPIEGFTYGSFTKRSVQFG